MYIRIFLSIVIPGGETSRKPLLAAASTFFKGFYQLPVADGS